MWVHDAAEPQLKDPKDIWTDVDSKYLYILDSGEGTRRCHDKESGDIVTQYASTSLNGAIGFRHSRNGQANSRCASK